MTRVVLFFGGKSPEHEVSIVSARNVFQQLQTAGFEAVPVGIGRDGRWHIGPSAFEVLEGRKAPDAVSQLAPHDQLAALRADVVFPLIHGVGGEDGTLPALCQLVGLPFVGGDLLNASLCWDKLTTRGMLLANGIPQLPFLAFSLADFEMEQALSAVEGAFPFPVFVKPSRTGSSIGVSRATDRASLEKALAEAFEFDYRVIVEPGVPNCLEVEVSGLGGLVPLISVPVRIIPENAFYDFEEKYVKNSTQFEVPAKLDPAVLEKLTRIAKQAWQVLNCYGMARIDFLISGEHVYLNEVNTIPGFTSISMYPRLLAEVGIDGPTLMKELVQLALDRPKNAPMRQDFSSGGDWWKGK